MPTRSPKHADSMSKALKAMNKVDQNADLGGEGRGLRRAQIAERAIGELGKSSALSDAQAAVAQMRTKWAAKVAEIIKAQKTPPQCRNSC